MLDTTICGSRPTHFSVHEEHAALFFDAEEGRVSSVTLLDDAAIGDSSVAQLVLEDMPATHLGNPGTIAEDSRIGSLYSHHDIDQLVAVAGAQFFVVDTSDAADPYLELNLPDGVSNITQGFSHSGEIFHVLGDNGNLYLFSTTAAWLMAEPVAVTTAPGEDDISPLMATSQSEDQLSLLDPGCGCLPSRTGRARPQAQSGQQVRGLLPYHL